MKKRIQRQKYLGVMAILGASIMWALEPIFARLSYEHASFLQSFALRTIFAFMIIAGYVFIKHRKQIIVKPDYLPKLLYLSLTATLFADLMYIYALTRVPVINAVLIGHMQPIFVILFGYFFLKKDRITAFDYLGIACMIFAGLLVSTKTLTNFEHFRIGSLGDLYVLSATIAWASTALVARKYLTAIPAGVIAFYRFLFAGIVFIIYMLAFRGIRITSIHQVFLGCVIGIGTILYYRGIHLIKAAQVSALELSTPFFAAVLAYTVLGELLTSMQIIGMLFLLCGVYFLSKKEPLNMPASG
jgi:drug/metabolite transporter (DMT)-like permease